MKNAVSILTILHTIYQATVQTVPAMCVCEYSVCSTKPDPYIYMTN